MARLVMPSLHAALAAHVCGRDPVAGGREMPCAFRNNEARRLAPQETTTVGPEPRRSDTRKTMTQIDASPDH